MEIPAIPAALAVAAMVPMLPLAVRVKRGREGEDSEERGLRGKGQEEEPQTSPQFMGSHSPTALTLRAGPAMGLVGTRESQFLSTYFTSLGLLSWVHEPAIRKTLLDVAFSGATKDGIVIPYGQGACQASLSIMWSVIAIGGLLQGCAPERLRGLVELARAALGLCYDEETPEVARAYVLLAFCYDFMGDTKKFARYVRFAENLVAGMETVPEDVRDTLAFAHHVRTFSSSSLAEKRAMALSSPETISRNAVLRQKDVMRLVVSVDREVCKSFYHDTLVGQKGGSVDELPTVAQVCQTHGPLLLGLEEAVARLDDINGSVNAFAVRSLSAYTTFLVGDLDTSIASLRTAMVFLLSYPGLMRASAWKHAAHAMIVAFAVIEDGRSYKRLREAYNSLKLPGYVLPEHMGDVEPERVCSEPFCYTTITSIKFKCSEYFGRQQAVIDEEIGLRDEEENFAAAGNWAASEGEDAGAWFGDRD